MQRVPEPELMDDVYQARAYAEADFSEPNSLFIEIFRERFPGLSLAGPVLDLGCGPADIPIRFARVYGECSVDAVDGAESMLEFGREAVATAGLTDRVRLILGRVPRLELEPAHYLAVVSNSLLHHMADPLELWRTVKHYGREGAAVLVMDLMRPEDEAKVDALVETYAADAPDVLQRDFRCSLCAAYTPDEVRRQLEGERLGSFEVSIASDRHWVAAGHLPA